MLIPPNQAVRASLTPAQLLKAASLFEIYSLNDCAAELIIEHRDRLERDVNCEELLDLLTPELRDHKLGYREYMKVYFTDTWNVSRALSVVKRLARFIARVVRWR
jgi:hypothetical protein